MKRSSNPTLNHLHRVTQPPSHRLGPDISFVLGDPNIYTIYSQTWDTLLTDHAIDQSTTRHSLILFDNIRHIQFSIFCSNINTIITSLPAALKTIKS
jgi:hypothetical protein